MIIDNRLVKIELCDRNILNFQKKSYWKIRAVFLSFIPIKDAVSFP